MPTVAVDLYDDSTGACLGDQVHATAYHCPLGLILHCHVCAIVVTWEGHDDTRVRSSARAAVWR